MGISIVIINSFNMEIKYVIPQPSALYLFKITGLYGVLNLYLNKEEALETFA